MDTRPRKWRDNPLVPIRPDRLGAALSMKGLSVRSAAEKLGIGNSTLHYILGGGPKRRCRQQVRVDLAALLDLPERWLAGDDQGAPTVLALLMEAETGDSYYRKEMETLPPRSQFEAIATARLLFRLGPTKGGRRRIPSYVLPILDLNTWRACLEGPEHATGPIEKEGRDADTFAVSVSQAVRSLVQPFSEGRLTLSRISAKALGDVAGVLIGTMDVLRSKDLASPIAWRSQLALMEQVAKLFRDVCALTLPSGAVNRRWLTKVGRVHEKIQGSRALLGRLRPKEFSAKDGYTTTELIKYARDHWAAARVLFEANPLYFDSAGHLAHLSIELLLKAHLLHKTDRFPAEHSLIKLYRQMREENPAFEPVNNEQEKTLRDLNRFSSIRYPGPDKPMEIGTDDKEPIHDLFGALFVRFPQELHPKDDKG